MQKSASASCEDQYILDNGYLFELDKSYPQVVMTPFTISVHSAYGRDSEGRLASEAGYAPVTAKLQIIIPDGNSEFAGDMNILVDQMQSAGSTVEEKLFTIQSTGNEIIAAMGPESYLMDRIGDMENSVLSGSVQGASVSEAEIESDAAGVQAAQGAHVDGAALSAYSRILTDPDAAGNNYRTILRFSGESEGEEQGSSYNRFDMTLYVQKEDGEREKVDELSAPIRVTASVPASLQGETVHLIHYAEIDGVTVPETLEYVESSDSSQITFVTPSLSEFALGTHTESEIPESAPTCTAPGFTGGVKCALCGEILIPPETIPATGHVWSSWTETIPATTGHANTAVRTCEICGEQETGSTQEKLPVFNIKPSLSRAKAEKKGKVTLTWKKFKQTKKNKAAWKKIKKVEIQYSTDPNFTAGAATKSKLTGKKKTKMILSLAKGATYYIRIRYTNGKNDYSAWSKTKKVKTKK